jgi:hypothetical protein
MSRITLQHPVRVESAHKISWTRSAISRAAFVSDESIAPGCYSVDDHDELLPDPE